jgi:hypothetical protein
MIQNWINQFMDIKNAVGKRANASAVHVEVGAAAMAVLKPVLLER